MYCEHIKIIIKCCVELTKIDFLEIYRVFTAVENPLIKSTFTLKKVAFGALLQKNPGERKGENGIPIR